MPSAQDDIGISIENLTSLVRAIISAADLTKLTKRLVRNNVIKSLGDRTPPNTAAFRAAVNSTITAVLAERSAAPPAGPNPKKAPKPKPHQKPRNPAEKAVSPDKPHHQPADTASPSPRPKPRARRVVVDDEDDEDDGGKQDGKGDGGGKDGGPANDQTEAIEADESEKSEKKESKGECTSNAKAKAEPNVSPAKSSSTYSTDLTLKLENDIASAKKPDSDTKAESKAAVKPASATEDGDKADDGGDAPGGNDEDDAEAADSDDDFSADVDDEPVVKRKRAAKSSPKQPPAKRARADPSPSPPRTGGEDENMSSGYSDEGEALPSESVAKREKKPSPRARKPKADARPEPVGEEAVRIERLNGVLRGLGLRVPPRCYVGMHGVKRSTVIVEFLRTKGVRNECPWLLTKREVGRHRARIEREKDLADLDVSNIIDDGKRATRSRRCAPLNIEEPKIEMPSDYSGSEASAGENEEEEEEEEEEDDGDDGGDYNADSDDSG